MKGSAPWLAWGVAAAVLLVGTAWSVRHLAPGRFLFDGFVPLDPYRWVPILPLGGAPALAGAGFLPLTAFGSAPGSIATGDGQAVVVFAKDGVPPREGESSIQVRITPLHYRRVPAAPPGLRIDGNAYRIEAAYAGSGQSVALDKAVTVLLTYPFHAEEILLFAGSSWTALPTAQFPTSQKLYGESHELGIFAAASPPRPRTGPNPWWPYLAAGAGLLAAAAAFFLARRGVLLARRGTVHRGSLRRPRG